MRDDRGGPFLPPRLEAATTLAGVPTSPRRAPHLTWARDAALAAPVLQVAARSRRYFLGGVGGACFLSWADFSFFLLVASCFFALSLDFGDLSPIAAFFA